MTHTEFLLTSYIYPIDTPIVLSACLGIYLDNPRTSDEIAEVSGFLERSFHHPEQRMFVERKQSERVSLEDVLERFHEFAGETNRSVRDYYAGYDPERLFEYLAGMWVIARYDDEGWTNTFEAESPRVTGIPTVVVLTEAHPAVRNANRLVSYSHALSLLANTEGEDYFGASFVIEEGYNSRPRRDTSRWIFSRYFARFSTFDLEWTLPVDEQDDGSWWIFPLAVPHLSGAAARLESILASKDAEKLLYCGDILALASPSRVRDVKVRLLLLVSILEAILTHNPDFSRFNVEDSINKQFQLKVSLLVYLKDRTRDLQALKKRLKTIYAMRSNVAHGNFGEIHKYVSKLSKTNGEEEYFDDLINDLYGYLKDVMNTWAEEPQLLQFLKDS